MKLLLTAFLIPTISLAQINLTISSVQYTSNPNGDSPWKDSLVTIKGVCSGTNMNGFFLQDAAPWGGVYVNDISFQFNSFPGLFDSATVTGYVREIDGNTQITDLISVGNVVTNNTNTVIPYGPYPIGDISQEKWEGVLVKIDSAKCIDTTGFSWTEQFVVDDGTGSIIVETSLDGLFNNFTPIPGLFYHASGPLLYETGVGYKLLPYADWDLWGLPLTNSDEVEMDEDFSLTPNPTKGQINCAGIIPGSTVRVFDVTGREIASLPLAITTIDIGHLPNGIYFIKIDEYSEKVVLQR